MPRPTKRAKVKAVKNVSAVEKKVELKQERMFEAPRVYHESERVLEVRQFVN